MTQRFFNDDRYDFIQPQKTYQNTRRLDDFEVKNGEFIDICNILVRNNSNKRILDPNSFPDRQKSFFISNKPFKHREMDCVLAFENYNNDEGEPYFWELVLMSQIKSLFPLLYQNICEYKFV